MNLQRGLQENTDALAQSLQTSLTEWSKFVRIQRDAAEI